ncbi:MAG: hypothetical protein AUH29_02465 [Candidatus Rokubacteria bacterium 13_1_40CM_69_27]|nr:MAG: hypothetical protein AUH29_02465 [Candidatus Rokubacteria bacterium 13_1_40CM_69_27]
MKPLTALLLSALLVLGIVGAATAQSGGAAPGSGTSNPETKADNPADRGNDPAPRPAPPERTGEPPPAVAPAEPRPNVNVDITSERGDEGSASPRTSGPTRILGLSPVVVILLAAVLFVVVILALVSLTRGTASRNDTHVDLDRRL